MISKRLQEIAKAAGDCRSFVDVGCDHGYAAALLLKEEPSRQGICADLREGPLLSAVENLRREKLLDRTRFLLSDGLRGLVLPETLLKQGEKNAFARFREKAEPMGASFFERTPEASLPDTLLIAGMGGQLMTDILGLLPTNGDLAYNRQELFPLARTALSKLERLILSPQSEPEVLRHFLIDRLDFDITKEQILLEEGRYYVILTVEPGKPADRSLYRKEGDYRYGVRLSCSRDPLFAEWLRQRQQSLRSLLQQLSQKGKGAEERRQALMQELMEVEERLN